LSQPLFVGSLVSVTWTSVLPSRENALLALGFAGSATTRVDFVVYFTATVGRCSVASPPEVFDASQSPAIFLKSDPPGRDDEPAAKSIFLVGCFASRFHPHRTAP